MNLYSEIIRDTSINTVSTQKYHPLPACSLLGRAGRFFSPPHDKSGFSTSKGEKDISDTRISDYFRRPYGQDCLKPRFQELFSPPAGGRGILPCGISDLSEKITDFIPQGEGEGDLFSSLTASLPHPNCREQAGPIFPSLPSPKIPTCRGRGGLNFSSLRSGCRWGR